MTLTNTFAVQVVQFGLLLLVTIMAARNLQQTWRSYKSGDWPRMHGTAIKSEVVESGLGSRKGFMGAFTWVVQYRYTVNGTVYTSKPQMPFPNTTKGNAAMMGQRLPIGSQVAIRYNPQNPSESTLATSQNGALLQFIARVIIYGAAFGVLFYMTFV
ncbi:MAG: DUF3592 domain-containing protein [Candidatus Promineifilaceae bacterium]